MSDERPNATVTELLRVRAERLKHQVAEVAEVVGLDVAEFSAGAERLALPLAAMEAAVPLRQVTPVPLAPPHVLGVFRYHGEVVTAFSLQALVGLDGGAGDGTTLLVVTVDGRRVAIDAEDIPRPAVLPQDAVERAQPRAGGGVSEVVVDGRRVGLLHLGKLLALKEALDAH